MKAQVRDTVVQLVNGPEISIPLAIARGEPEGPAKGRSVYCACQSPNDLEQEA